MHCFRFIFDICTPLNCLLPEWASNWGPKRHWLDDLIGFGVSYLGTM